MKALFVFGLFLIFAGGFIVGASFGVRYADAGGITLKLNSDKSVTMRAYDGSGKIIAERRQSLDDPISTLYDF